MTESVMALAAIYDSSLLVSVLDKDNYNLPCWRKKEQPYDSSAGNRSFHSYNRLRGLFIVWILQNIYTYKQLRSTMILFCSHPSHIKFWLFSPLKPSSSPLNTKMCVQLQLYTSKAYRMQSGQRDAFRDVNFILIILPSHLSLWSVSCLPGKHQAQSTTQQ